jgi:hypothetical protein
VPIVLCSHSGYSFSKIEGDILGQGLRLVCL